MMTNYLHTIIRPGIDAHWEKEDPVFEPAPCDDCKSYDYCAENEAACLDFSRYVNTGKILNYKRDPSRSIYKRVFRRSEYGGT